MRDGNNNLSDMKVSTYNVTDYKKDFYPQGKINNIMYSNNNMIHNSNIHENIIESKNPAITYKSKNENLNLPNYNLIKNDTIIKTHMKKNSDEINSNFTSINVNIIDPNKNVNDDGFDIDKIHDFNSNIKNSSNFNNDSNLSNKNFNIENIISNNNNYKNNSSAAFEIEKKNPSLFNKESSNLNAEKYSSNEIDNLLNEAKLS